MLINLSLVLAIILNSIFIRHIFKLSNTFIDFSIFQSMSSIEQFIINIPLFIILPALGIYYILRKLQFEQKLQDMKEVKTIFNILLTLIISLIAILLFSKLIDSRGELGTAISLLFVFYVLPVMILLFIIAMGMIISRLIKSRKNTYNNLPFSKKEINSLKYTTILSIITAFIILLNPYGSTVKNFKINTTFNEQCLNAKTTVYDEISLDSIFLFTNSQNSYYAINSFNNYHSYQSEDLPYSSIIVDLNATFETYNDNEKTNHDFKYKYYDSESEENYKNGVERKILKSKYGYIEKQIYNNHSITGNSVEIIKLDNNKTIARSVYYINEKTRKVCGDLIRSNGYGEMRLTPFDLVLDILKKQKMTN